MKNYSLENPFAENDLPSPVKDQEQEVPSRYQEMVNRGGELLELPKKVEVKAEFRSSTVRGE